MLNELIITNFVIADSVEIDFDSRLNIVTGETGAGKSILLNALGLCLGAKADANLVKQGKQQAEINAYFDLSNNTAAQTWLRENDVNNDDNECLVRRVVKAKGTSRAHINGQACTVQQLREFGEHLVYIHSQHQHQQLNKTDYQRELIDNYGQHKDLVKNVQQHYHTWRKAYDLWQRQLNSQQESEQRKEFLRFQLDELATLAPQTDEVEELETQQRLLNNSEEIISNFQHALEALTESEVNTETLLAQASNYIQDNLKHSSDLEDIKNTLESALINIQEAASDINERLNRTTIDPEQLAEIEQRLSDYYQLARKHQCEPDQLHTVFTQLQDELNILDDPEQSLRILEKNTEAAHETYMKLAQQLSEKRCKAGLEFSQNVIAHIHRLGMDNSELSVELEASEKMSPQAHGLETISFHFNANKGQPLRPLNKVASGGELSRISLAIQTVAAQTTSIPSVFFDEVDVGIGGAVAEMVGENLLALSKHTQIFCITHLAQVAAHGQAHWKVEKKLVDNLTISTITPLDVDERVMELARMQGGKALTPELINHARVLLEQTQKK